MSKVHPRDKMVAWDDPAAGAMCKRADCCRGAAAMPEWNLRASEVLYCSDECRTIDAERGAMAARIEQRAAPARRSAPRQHVDKPRHDASHRVRRTALARLLPAETKPRPVPKPRRPDRPHAARGPRQDRLAQIRRDRERRRCAAGPLDLGRQPWWQRLLDGLNNLLARWGLWA